MIVRNKRSDKILPNKLALINLHYKIRSYNINDINDITVRRPPSQVTSQSPDVWVVHVQLSVTDIHNTGLCIVMVNIWFCHGEYIFQILKDFAVSIHLYTGPRARQRQRKVKFNTIFNVKPPYIAAENAAIQ